MAKAGFMAKAMILEKLKAKALYFANFMILPQLMTLAEIVWFSR